jgi:hypothetical protein
MKPYGLKVNGRHIKWSKPDSESQRPYVFSRMWGIDTIQIQAILWKTGYT